MKSPTFLGIEIGGTKLQVVAGTADGTITRRQKRDVDAAQGGAGIRKQLESMLPALVEEMGASGLGVGFGGPVLRQEGIISQSHQIEGWGGFPLTAWLGDLTGCPVQIDNDANLAALAEAHCGSGQGFDPVFYVTLGSGVGGGLVLGGGVYHGAMPGESEIGHLRLDADGTLLEHRCSGWAVDQAIREACTRPEWSHSRLASLVAASPGSEARHLAAALEVNDDLAREILDRCARDLALGLSHVIHLFHPQVVVLGGGLSLLGQPLRESVMMHLPPLVMEVFQKTTPLEVRLASLAEDAVPVGALILAGNAA